jgi:hypothetical protein
MPGYETVHLSRGCRPNFFPEAQIKASWVNDLRKARSLDNVK